ncbi:MAG TPA: fibronectin type III domain-containing protein [Pseudonocardiaceae bacterium]
MTHTRVRATLWAAMVALLVVFISWGTADVAAAGTSPSWTGTFDNFHTSGWNSSWGLTSDTAQCPIAVGTYNCNWGYGNLQAVNDATSPSGQALKVTYPANSGPPSCYKSSSGCALGGGQFYQDLTSNGQTALHNSSTIDLKYYYNFPVGFDFGKKTAGKMPGLYGGVPGCESGGQHCSNGWSTRYMWRGGSASAPKGELYFYGGSGSGYGQDICLGNWTFPADGHWHSIEQSVNISTGAVTIWSDGKSVCTTTQTFASPVSGVFFSTFHGGHDTSWSPTKTTTSEFSDFTLSTDGPQTSGGGGTPATPTGLAVTGSTNSSISLSWQEANNSDPAASYKVYEGGTVVATSTTTSATITGLAAGSSHTYTVSAVDASGSASPQSTAVTGSTTGGGGNSPAVPTGLTVSGATSSSLKLSWNETNNTDPATSYKVYDGTNAVATPTTTSATITGLAAGSTHTYTVTAVDATGVESAHSTSATGTTTGGGGSATVTIAKTKDWGSGYTDTATVTNDSGSAINGWNVQFDLDASMNIESASNATYGSTGNHYTLTNTSSDATIAAGSTQTVVFSGDYATSYIAPANVTFNGNGTTGGATPATPTGLTETTETTSSITLGWTEPSTSDPAVSYKVYEGSNVVATPTTTSATIGGLAAGSTHTYTVSAVDGSGNQSTQSAPVTASTSNSGAAPATPTSLAVTGTTSSSISLGWTEANNSDPAASYNVYEGGTIVASLTTTTTTITGLAAGSSHTYTVTAVDSAAVESAHSSSVTGTTGGSGGTPFSQAEIDSAVGAPAFAWAAPTSAVPRPGTNPAYIGEAKVLYYLALVDRQAPGAKATNGTTVDSAVLTQVRSLIAGGHEPDADGGLEMWGQAPVAQALLLVKNGPAWPELTSAEQNKVTLLEAAMGYGSNYAYNDGNSFSSGICGFGNFSKTNNPNYRDGGVDTEIAAIQYFGASTWDSMLASFNDATVTSQLNAAGLTNAGGCFQTLGSGGNSAINKAFVYQGHHSSDLMGLWSVLAGDTFDKTAQSTVGKAHIADNTASPYNGQCCMGHEFDSTDSSGLRSSALYVFEGWMNVTDARVTMMALGNFTLASATTESQYHIGTLDLKYKLDHGYVCYALNQTGLLVNDQGQPATDGPNVKGFLYDWDAYSVAGAPQS